MQGLNYELSVVIPTYNRAERIYETFRSLESQTFKNFEVIVVNDGSSHNAFVYLEKELKRSNFTFPFQIIHQENKGRAGARNTGIAKAKGKIIVSTDDDVLLDNNCLKIHYQHHQNLPRSIMTGCVADNESLASTDIQKYKVHITRKWEEVLLRKGFHKIKKEEIYLSAANFSIPQSLFYFLGVFNPQLNTSIDIELAIRAYQQKVPIFFNPEAIVHHWDEITCASYIHRKRQDPIGREKLKEIHPTLSKEFITLSDTYSKKNLPICKRWLYRFLARKRFVSWIDQSSIFLILIPIRKIRYRFYSALIFSLSKIHINIPI